MDHDYSSNGSHQNIQSSNKSNTLVSTPTRKLFEKLLEKLDSSRLTNANANVTNLTQVNTVPDNRVTFLVGKEKEQLKFSETQTLVGKSSVLDKLITHRPTLTSPVEIKNCHSAKVFGVFLEYLKTDGFKSEEPDISVYVADLIRLCMDYEIAHLVGRFVPVAKQTMTLDNCMELYLLGAMKDIEELRVAANSFFLRMGNDFLEHPSFLTLDPITLSILISSDCFPVVETVLFRRLREWVTGQCKKLGYPPDRKEYFGRVAGVLFNHVRYTQMTPKEFQKEVVPSGLLSEKDIEGVNLRYGTYHGYWHLLPPYQFVDRPRLNKLEFSVPLYNNVQMGFRKIAGASSTIQESVRFIVSHNIYLTSIGFYGPARGAINLNHPLTAYSIKILVEGDYTKHYSRIPMQVTTVFAADNFSVDLPYPIFIQKLEPHKLTVWIDGEVTQFGVFPLPQAVVLVNSKNIPMITFHFGDADGDPIPKLEPSGRPTGAAPMMITTPPKNSNKFQYKNEPRCSGVIRCITFQVKEKQAFADENLI